MFYLVLSLQFDNELHMLVEKSAFIQKQSRKYKFRILFFISGIMVITIIYFNLDYTQWQRPPIRWYTNSKLKCEDKEPHFRGMFIGMKETFLDTGILICIPIMVFGVSFTMNLDSENLKWTKTSFLTTCTRLAIGISLSLSIDLLIWWLTQDLTDFTTIFFWKY